MTAWRASAERDRPALCRKPRKCRPKRIGAPPIPLRPFARGAFPAGRAAVRVGRTGRAAGPGWHRQMAGWPEKTGPGLRSPGEPAVRPDLLPQDKRGQRALGPAPVPPPRRPVPVLASAGAGRHQLAGRVDHPLRRHPTEGLGWQSNLGRCASAVGPEVGVADVLATGAFGPGFPQPALAGHSRLPGLAPVTCASPTQRLILLRQRLPADTMR
jgi:hypothetical protein